MSMMGAACELATMGARAIVYPWDVLGDEDPATIFVYAVEMYPFNLGVAGVEVIGGAPIASLPLTEVSATEPLYFATREYVTGPTDSPANQLFEGRLMKPLQMTRSILGSDRFAAIASPSEGRLTIANGDGQFDGYVSGYGIDGRRLVVKVGRATDAYADFVTLFDGTARDWFFDHDLIEVVLRDNSFKLADPAQDAVYGGAGGSDGGDDLSGKRRPKILGTVEHGPLTLVDAALLIYQATDGAIASGVVVYDQGVALTPNGAPVADYAALVAIALAAGEYEVCPTEGYVKLGSLPAGRVTFGDAVGGGFVTTADIAADVIASSSLPGQEIDVGSWNLFEERRPETVGAFIGQDDAASVGEAVASLLDGVGSFAAFDRLGRLFVRLVELPAAASAVDDFPVTEVIRLDRAPLPGGLSPPPWRVRVAHLRNYQEMSGDLAAAVTAARRSYLAQPYQLATASSADVLAAHPLAQDRAPVEAFYADEADAAAEAERLLALYGTVRSLWRMTLPRRALLLELGDVITVSYSRFGLSSPTPMMVVETTPNINGGSDVETVEVIAYG